MWRAALLDAQLFEEVEHERRSMGQAWVVVLLAAAAGGLGSHLAGLSAERVTIDMLEPLVFWLCGSVFTYMVGATFLRGPHTATDYREVLRTTGFAFAPGLLRVLACLPAPWLARGIPIAGDLWMLAAGIVAVRQALDFTTLRAVATFGLSYVLLWLSFEGLLFSLPL